MNIRYSITLQTVAIVIVGTLCLGHGTAAAVTFPALMARHSQAAVTSPDALSLTSGLTDAPSLMVAVLGDQRDEDATFDSIVDAPNAGAPASVDTLGAFAIEGDAYSEMASTRGFESSRNGRVWTGSLLAAGVAVGVLHASHAFGPGGPGASQGHGIPSSTPSIGSDDTPTIPADVPEPGTVALFAMGIGISAALRRRPTRA